MPVRSCPVCLTGTAADFSARGIASRGGSDDTNTQREVRRGREVKEILSPVGTPFLFPWEKWNGNFRRRPCACQPGSVHRIGDASRQSVPCRIISIDGIHVEVCTEFPCREVTLWVLASWIEEVVIGVGGIGLILSRVEPALAEPVACRQRKKTVPVSMR